MYRGQKVMIFEHPEDMTGKVLKKNVYKDEEGEHYIKHEGNHISVIERPGLFPEHAWEQAAE